jgi:PAS domain S-box-containing protein
VLPKAARKKSAGAPEMSLRQQQPLTRAALQALLKRHGHDPFTKRLLATTAALIMLVWAMLLLDLWRVHEERLGNARDQTENLTRAVSERVVRTVKIADIILREAAEALRGPRPPMAPAEVERILRGIDPHTSDILSLLFIDAEGHGFASSNPAVPAQQSFADQETFRIHVSHPETGLFVGPPTVGGAWGERVLVLSRSVEGTQGGFIGIVAAAIRVDELADSLENLRIGPHGSAGIVFLPTNSVVARQPDYPQNFGRALPNTLLIENLERSASGTFDQAESLGGDARILAFRRINDLPLAVVAGVAVSDIYSELGRELTGYIAMAVLFTFLIGLGTFIIFGAYLRQLAFGDALRASEARMTNAQHLAQIGDWSRNLIDGKLHWSTETFRILGWQPGEIEPSYQAFLSRVHPDDRQAARADLDTAIRDKQGYSGELRLLMPDGSERIVHRQVEIELADNGEVREITGILQDVSERRTAEDKLKKWRQIFLNAEWGIAVSSADGSRIEEMNPAFARMHGYSVAELTGQAMDIVFPTEHGPQRRDHVELNNKQLHRRFDAMHKHRDGHLFPVAVDATTVRAADGAVLYRVMNVQDVTELRQAQEQMRIATEFFRNIFDAAPVGIAVTDLAGRYIRVNRAMCQFVGYAESELLHMSFMDVTHPDDIVANVSGRRRLLDGEQSTFQMEKRYLRKDGTPAWALMVVSLVRDSKDTPLYIIGQTLDIETQKRSEQALRASRASLANAQRIASLGDWEWHVRDNNMHWSDETYQIYGLATGDFAATFEDFLERVHPDDRTPLQRTLERAMRTRQPMHIDHRILRPDGSERVVSEQAECVFDAAGHPERVVGTVQDITERKQVEMDLIRSREQLRSLSAYHEHLLEEERKHIAREVHDELGQLLTALKMDLSLLRLRFGDLPELGAKAEEMRHLVERTINVVRHVSSNLRPAALDLGLAAALDWLAEDFRHRWEISCKVKIAEEQIPIDSAHAIVIFRVVQESLTNIARHAEATEVIISLLWVEKELHLFIQDNGRGFDPGLVRRQPGFGLLGMRERVLSLEGRLHIDTAPGKGTTVVIEIPIASGGKA